MLCVNYARKCNASAVLNHVLKCRYSRRSDKSTSSYKVVKSSRDSIDDVDGAVFGTNANWELLTPRGFRFYLPGSVGPGWSDASTTVQTSSQFVNYYDGGGPSADSRNVEPKRPRSDSTSENAQAVLHCVAQECPLLLRKGIDELFPGHLDTGSSQLTIITISQKTNLRTMRWSKEIETERLAKYFVLAASDVCSKLKMIGYWADFINPFSGQPHLNPQKNHALYKWDERFRCLGFKVENKNNCKIISYDNNGKNFIGSLYTTAPASTEFLREIMSDCELVNVSEG